MIMLFVPNIIWSRNPHENEMFLHDENRILLILERAGQVLVTIFSLFCGASLSFNPVFLVAFLFLIIYELYWIRYFRNPDCDMYASFLMIPLPVATLPVLAFVLLGVYSDNIFLIISTVILAIGHISIHMNHKNEL